MRKSSGPFNPLVFLIFSLLAPSAFGFNVIIDPGHGGKDHGAVKGQLKESELTLDVSLHLAKMLRRHPHIKVAMTRTSDKTLSLQDRARIARRKKGDLFVSIHVNSSSDPRAKGGEFYFQNQLPPDEESMFLASKENLEEEGRKEVIHWPLFPVAQADSLKPDVVNIIQDLQRNFRINKSSEFVTSLVNNWRGQRKSRENTVRQAPFYVVSNVNMPSALVEVGFLTNKKEAKKLVQPTYQKTVAQSLYNGIAEFLKTMDK